MFCVLGEGRGHMTQAMAVKEMAEAAGHQVVAITVGASSHRPLPEYFTSAMKMPVRQMPTLEFKYKNNRAVSNTATLLAVLGNLPKYFGYIRQLEAVVHETKPDVIINFFEPIAAFYALTRRKRPPRPRPIMPTGSRRKRLNNRPQTANPPSRGSLPAA